MVSPQSWQGFEGVLSVYYQKGAPGDGGIWGTFGGEVAWRRSERVRVTIVGEPAVETRNWAKAAVPTTVKDAGILAIVRLVRYCCRSRAPGGEVSEVSA
jgi:hypothetical protein